MEYHINPYNLLIGFGTIQGLVFGTLLVWKSNFKEANKYLGLCVLFLSCYLVWMLKYDYGFQDQFIYLRFLPVLFLWGIGPSFYIYLRFLFGTPMPTKIVRWHFLPLLIELIYFNSTTFIFWINDWTRDGFNSFESVWVFSLFSIEHIVGLASLAIYLIMSLQLHRQHKLEFTSRKITLILSCFGILWLLWVPYTYLDSVYYNFRFPPSGFYLFYLLFAALSYGIGFIGFRLIPQTTIKSLDISLEMKNLAKEIDRKMQEEKYFLNPELNIDLFSKSLDIHPNKISGILNNVLHQSFRDFVNAYRIEEFKSRIKSYDLKNQTILGLAFDVGFNSKASFNRVFKKSMNISPIDYLNQTKESRSQNI